MLETLNNKLKSNEPFSDTEILIIKEILKRTNGLSIRKVGRASTKVELGLAHDNPINPITGYEYKEPTNQCLLEAMKEEGWCGQFAGAAQWSRVGRVLKEEVRSPAYEYESLYHTRENPKIIKLYAYEQTKPV